MKVVVFAIRAARAGGLAVCIGGAQAAAQQDCLDWKKAEFFLSATPEGVAECIDNQGAAVDAAAGSSLKEFIEGRLDGDPYLEDSDAPGSGGATPLHMAAGLSRDPEVVRILVDRDAKLSVPDASGATPLHWAAALSGDPEVISVLLEAGADRSLRNGDGRLPWDMASENPLLDDGDVALLRPSGASDPPASGREGEEPNRRDNAQARSCPAWGTPGFFRSATPEDVRHCLASGADTGMRGPRGFMPLHLAAAFSREPDVISALLDAGADKLATTDSGFIPWEVLRDDRVKQSAAGRRLRPADCRDWISIAFFAAASGREVERCLAEGADPRAASRNGWTALHIAAAFSPAPESVRILAGAGADVHARSEGGWTPLHRAAERSAVPAVVEALVDLRAAVNARTDDSLTPLHVAARSSRFPEVLQALVDAEADIRARTADGRLAIDLAAENAALEGASVRDRLRPARCEDWLSIGFFRQAAIGEVRRCLDAGRRLDETSRSGWTPLHLAAAFSPTARVVEFLIEAGADPGARSEGGWTPLHRAAEHTTQPEVVAVLLDAGSAADVRTDDGRTPLHLAAVRNRTPAVVAALLDAGADPLARAADGLTARDFAMENSDLQGTAVWRRLEGPAR